MSDRALSPPLSKPAASEDNMALIARLLPLDIAVFLVYLTVGAPLPVIPLFVNDRLGFDPIIVGIVIGAQAAATLLARPLAGGVSDKRGTRAAVMIGALISVLAGIFYFIGTLLESSPVASLVAIIAGRIGGREVAGQPHVDRPLEQIVPVGVPLDLGQPHPRPPVGVVNE